MKNFFYICLSILLLFFVNCSNQNSKPKKLTIQILDTNVTDNSFNRLVEILNERFYQLEIEDIKIQRTSSNTFQIESAELLNKDDDIIQIILKKGFVEFKLIPEKEYVINVMNKVDSVLRNWIASNYEENFEDESSLDVYQQLDLKDKEFKREHPFFSIALLDPQFRSADAFVREQERDSLENFLKLSEIQKIIPEELQFTFSAISQVDNEGNKFEMMYVVYKHSELSGDIIIDATASIDPSSEAPVINFTLNSYAADQWSNITAENIHKRIAILIDGLVYIAPVVRARIPSGRCQIEGAENIDDARAIATILKSGTLPHSLTVIKDE